MFQPEISFIVEIFTDFDLLGIIEFQIYGLILPILQANIGKNIFNCIMYENHVLTQKKLYNIGYLVVPTS